MLLYVKVLYSGVWFLFRHVKSHANSSGTAGVNERCRGARMQRTPKVCCSQCIGFSASLLLLTHTRTKVIVPEAHFRAELFAASPIVIGRKTAKLFELLYRPTQCGPSITALAKFMGKYWLNNSS